MRLLSTAEAKTPKGPKSRKIHGLTCFRTTLKLPLMRSFPAVFGLALAVAAGCTSPNTLPPATITNRIDTVAVFAVSGTPVYQPSGYSMTERRLVRLDQSVTADFAYDHTAAGKRVLLPAALIGHGITTSPPGFQVTPVPFDSLKLAKTEGYLTLDTVAVAAGDVLYARSRVPTTCYLGLPAYGKLEVLSFDDLAGTMLFRVLVNLNCGYTSLETGLPVR